MFKKMQNRKGFTLIEMLAVIAIVAILVAVIIPVVNGSTDKAAAATNASNLRGVEGEIITMMLLDPTIFGDQEGEFERIQGEIDDTNADTAQIEERREALTEAAELVDTAAAVLNRLGISNSVNVSTLTGDDLPNLQKELESKKKTLNDHLDSASRFHVALFCGTCIEWNARIGMSEAEIEYVNRKVAYEEAVNANNEKVSNLQGQQNELYLFRAVNGKITLSPEVVLEAPVSKAVSTDNVNIAKDVEMIVYVDTSEYNAYAYYPSGDTKYNAHNFAVAAGNEDLAG